MAHLIDDKTVAKMGHPVVCNPEHQASPISHISTPIHTTCTTPAPCPSTRSRLPSNDALLLTSKRRTNPKNFASFRENPQQNPLFFAIPGHLPRINTGIRASNTICCALYLTHPTEGVTFTTAHRQSCSVVSNFLPSVRSNFIAPLPTTPTQRRSITQRCRARKTHHKTGPDSPNAVSQKL